MSAASNAMGDRIRPLPRARSLIRVRVFDARRDVSAVADSPAATHAELRIGAVEHMCVRLRRGRHRRRLVRSIDALLEGEAGRFDVVTTPWRFMRSDLIAPVRHELIEIGALLRDDRSGLPGIAMMERLLFDGTSSLHGDSPRLLRDDLRRARFLLAATRV